VPLPPAYAQQYGSFLEAQAEQQQKENKPVDVSRLKAAAAAIPAAAIDVLETLSLWVRVRSSRCSPVWQSCLIKERPKKPKRWLCASWRTKVS